MIRCRKPPVSRNRKLSLSLVLRDGLRRVIKVAMEAHTQETL